MGRTRKGNGGTKQTKTFTGRDADLKLIACTDKVLAHERLYFRYRESLFWHARGIVKDAQVAEDIVQEVFVRAYREERIFTKSFRAKAWLYKVTSNLCFNHIRDRKRRATILEEHGSMLAPPTRDLQRGVYNQQVGGVWGKLMAQLTEDHRQIIKLRYWADLTYAQISMHLGIKPGTVMSRLSRARAKLARIAEADGYDAQTLDHAA